MCEILFLNDPGGIKRDEAACLFDKGIVPASARNDDGFGYFTESRLYRSTVFEKECRDSFLSDAVGAKFIVVHLRSATSGGISLENTHPLQIGRWVMVHNGIVFGLGNKKMSDSVEFLIEFSKKKGTVLERLRILMKEVNGTFSFFLYEFPRRLFYFKNSGTQFIFAKFHDAVLGASKKECIKPIGSQGGGFFCDPKLYRAPEAGKLLAIDFEAGRITSAGKVEEFSPQKTFYFPSHLKNLYYSQEAYYDE